VATGVVCSIVPLLVAVGCERQKADVQPDPKGAGAPSGVVVLAHVADAAAEVPEAFDANDASDAKEGGKSDAGDADSSLAARKAAIAAELAKLEAKMIGALTADASGASNVLVDPGPTGPSVLDQAAGGTTGKAGVGGAGLPAPGKVGAKDAP